MREVGGRVGYEGLEGVERCRERRLAEEVGAFDVKAVFPSAQVHRVIIQQLAADRGETLGLVSLKVLWLVGPEPVGMLGVYTKVECALVVHLLAEEVVSHVASTLTSPAEQPMHFGPPRETPDWAAGKVAEIRLREFVQVPAQVAAAALAA